VIPERIIFVSRGITVCVYTHRAFHSICYIAITYYTRCMYQSPNWTLLRNARYTDIIYHIISYHISYATYTDIIYHISYHISYATYTDIIYHISYHISYATYTDIIYHIISYHIISYHIISYHIISYHIISYHISYATYTDIIYHIYPVLKRGVRTQWRVQGNAVKCCSVCCMCIMLVCYRQVRQLNLSMIARSLAYDTIH